MKSFALVALVVLSLTSQSAMAADSKGFRFNFAILGMHSVNMSGATVVSKRASDLRQSTMGASDAFVASYGDIIGGNPYRVGDSNLVVSMGSNRGMSLHPRASAAQIPPTPAAPPSPLPAPLEAPTNKHVVSAAMPDRFGQAGPLRPKSDEIMLLPNSDRMFGLSLGPGDYIVKAGRIPSFAIASTDSGSEGPIRIFLQDDGANNQFTIDRNGGGGSQLQSPGKIQFWYSGKGSIKSNGITDLSAIIYAPKASLNFSGITHFHGAVVADDVTATGITDFYYDPDLREIDFWNYHPETLAQSPYLPFAGFGVHSAVLTQDAQAKGETNNTFDMYGRPSSKSAVYIGSFGTAKIENANPYTGKRVQVAGGPKSIPPVPKPTGKVVKYSWSDDKSVMPKPGEIADLGTIDTSKHISLAPGNYLVHGLRLTSGASITARRNENGEGGAIRIYIDGEAWPHTALDLDDASVGTGSSPKNFQIFYSGEQNMVMSGNSLISGFVYAPNANFEMKGSSMVHGAVLADNLNLSNHASITYSDALGKGDVWGKGQLPDAPAAPPDQQPQQRPGIPQLETKNPNDDVRIHDKGSDGNVAIFEIDGKKVDISTGGNIDINGTENGLEIRIDGQSIGQRAQQLMFSGDVKGAANLLQQGINAKPDGVLYNDLADCYNNLGQYQKALDACNEGLKLAPNDPYLLSTRAWAFDGLGRTEESGADARRALSLLPQPQGPAELMVSGTSKMFSGKPADAIADLSKAIDSMPNFWYAYNCRAMAEDRAGDKSAASADRKKAESLKQTASNPANMPKSVQVNWLSNGA